MAKREAGLTTDNALMTNNAGDAAVVETYLGEIALFPYAKIPVDWLPCDGRKLAINKYQALFALIGKTYGGDGIENFCIPDLRGRVIIGQGRRDQYTYPMGAAGGLESVTLQEGQLPPHGHNLMAYDGGGGQVLFVDKCLGVSQNDPLYASCDPTNLVPLAPESVGSVGGGGAHDNMQPFLTMTYCIATGGNYPNSSL